MFNPIRFIATIVELVRNPSGDVVAAREITPMLWEQYRSEFEEAAKECIRKPQIGDFMVEFERSDIWSICPRDEFLKTYRLRGPEAYRSANENGMYPVINIGPIK